MTEGAVKREHIEAKKKERNKQIQTLGWASMMAKMWEISRAPGPGSVLWGAQISGEWLDTGRTDEETDIILGTSETARRMGKVFGIEKRIAVAGKVGRGYESVVKGEDVEVAEDSIQIRSHLTGGKIRLAGKSQVHLVGWAGDIELVEGSVMSEAAVYGERGSDWIVHVLWHMEDSPKEERKDSSKSDVTHYGYEIARWAERLGIKREDIWPEGTKGTLMTAKIFPGVSAQVLETGMAVDELDEALMSDLPKIWREIQAHEGKMPESWHAALRMKRLFSMNDMYEHSAAQLFARRRGKIKEEAMFFVCWRFCPLLQWFLPLTL